MMRRAAIAILTALALAPSASAVLSPSLASAAPAAHWTVMASAGPTYFRPGDVGDYYEIKAVNDGAVQTSGAPITVTDSLPAGVTATAIGGLVYSANSPNNREGMACSTVTVSCGVGTTVRPGEVVRLKIVVSVAEGLSGSLTNSVEIFGGDTEPGHATTSTPLSSEPVPFGASLVSAIIDEAGAAKSQAGSHPFGFTSILAFNVGSINRSQQCEPVQLYGCPELSFNPKDLEVALPAGLLGNPLALPRCPQTNFQSYAAEAVNCPADTQVGSLEVFFYGNGSAVQYAPVYNVEPPPGQPAELGFSIGGFFHIPMFFHLRPDGDYGLTSDLKGITEVDIPQSAVLTIWGVPGASSHDGQRKGGGCPAGCVSQKPFLTLPTSCTGEELAIGLSGDSWQNPGVFFSEAPTYFPPITGCEALSFAPSLEVKPDLAEARAPSGYSVKIGVPQTESVETLATPHLRDAVIKLPAGTAISPSVANGLQACTEAQLGFADDAPAQCPPRSQIGEVEVLTPLLEDPLHGGLFIAQPRCGAPGQPPCTQASATNGELYRLYLTVEGSGIALKLRGSAAADPATGQLTATFKENPQLPFVELRVHLKAGPTAPLANPRGCGTFTTTSNLTPWSAPATPEATPSSSFQLSGCPGSSSFAPAFDAGTVNPVAGAYSPFGLALRRSDQDAEFSSLSSLSLPPGLSASLRGTTYCPDSALAAAAGRSGAQERSAPSCPASSLIGTATVGAGPGPSPFYVNGGKVYLAGPYKGAPLSLAVSVPALAGPFDLGNVIVRSALYVDPTDASLRAVSDPFPTILDGIPLQVRDIRLSIDRPHFTLNPTNCEPMSIDATVRSTESQSANLHARFQAGECAALGFRPKLALSLKGPTKRAKHPALKAVLTYPPKGNYANIARAQVTLPHSEFLDQSHIGTVCTRVQFAAGACPAASVYGHARAITPLLDQPLEGPVYLRSSSHKLPDLVAALGGQINVDLAGKVDTGKGGGIRNTFEVVPDAPVSKFTLEMQGGSKGLLVNSENICRKPQKALAHFVAQNGKVDNFKPTIANSCPKMNRKGHQHKGAHE